MELHLHRNHPWTENQVCTCALWHALLLNAELGFLLGYVRVVLTAVIHNAPAVTQ